SYVLGIDRLPAYGNLGFLGVIPGVCRGLVRVQDRRSIVAVPFLSFGKVHLKAVEPGEIPCRTGERHTHFLVDSPDIPIHAEALPIGRTNRVERVIERITKPRLADFPDGQVLSFVSGVTETELPVPSLEIVTKLAHLPTKTDIEQRIPVGELFTPWASIVNPTKPDAGSHRHGNPINS